MKYLLAVVLVGVLAVPCWAQDSGDAPEHGVARISLLKGDVTVRRGDSGELVTAELNAPLVARDHVLTDEDSRAEVQLDWANFVRIASNSEIRMAELADRDFLIQVAAGTVTFRVLRDSNSQVEISTPTVAIRPRLQGTYRVTVRDDASTELTVRSGEVEIFSGQRTDYIRSGQTLIVSGDPSNPQRTYRSAIPYDEWDRWNESRDRDLERADSYKYISRDIYGAEDLYGHGRWVYDSPYGWVWVPTVSASWAPYRVGRWSWVDYYGWTWISGDPWGWAPYHYGRWYHAPRYGWVWYPGEVRVRYYWRPALVAFFGWGSVNVGWVSLAPFEVYRPWYGRGRTTVVNNVTIVNNINVINTYRNARFVSGRSGVTSIVSNDFGRRRVTVNTYVVGNDRDFSRAGDAGRWLGREPSRENRQFSDRQVSPQVATRVANRREVDRQFVSTRPDRDNRNRRDGGNTQQAEIRTPPRSAPNQTALPAVNARRADSQRNETARPQESGRGRGENAAVPSTGAAANPNQGNNRGRNENPTGVAATAVPDNSRRNETPRQNEPVVFPRNEPERERQQGNRGRNESPTVAATPVPDNSRRNEAPRQNEPVVFPRNEPERERQQGNRGRNESPTVAATPVPDNSRRNEAPRQNEPVVFPRNEPERERQQGNRGRNESPTVAATPVPDNSRRNEAPRQNEPVVFPRNEPERVRQPENNRSNEGVAQRQNEPPRQSQAPETSRRAEPPPQRNRPEEIQRPQAPSRAPAPERVRESSPPPQQQAPPAPRPESRNNPAPPPQASAPAPSPAPSSNSEQGNSGGGGGRGRGRNDR